MPMPYQFSDHTIFFVFELRLLQFWMFVHFAVLRYQQKHFRNIEIVEKFEN